MENKFVNRKLEKRGVAGRWFSPSSPVSFTNKTDRHHDITEILLKVALNIITLTRSNVCIHKARP
jgi:hypothetical protein